MGLRVRSVERPSLLQVTLPGARGDALLASLRSFCKWRGRSNFEVQTQLVIAGKLDYGSTEGILECEGLSIEVGKMLNGLMKTL